GKFVLIPAGISGLFNCSFGKTDWSSFLKSMVSGAIIGAFTAGFSKIANMIVGRIGTALKNVPNLISRACKFSVEAVSSFLGNFFGEGISNLVCGENFF